MTKWECLNCKHLDIEYSGIASCTGYYDAKAIRKSINGEPCEFFEEQESRNKG